jgi:hypothetical protein
MENFIGGDLTSIAHAETMTVKVETSGMDSKLEHVCKDIALQM